MRAPARADAQPAPVPAQRPLRIRDDAQALQIARELAADFARDAAVRDRERRLPWDELERFTASGLWAITVPREHGGAGVSARTLAEVIAIISAADGSLGQIPQNHYYALEVLRVGGTEAQKSFSTAACSKASASAMRSRRSATRTSSAERACTRRAAACRSTGRSSTAPAHCSRTGFPRWSWHRRANAK